MFGGTHNNSFSFLYGARWNVHNGKIISVVDHKRFTPYKTTHINIKACKNEFHALWIHDFAYAYTKWSDVACNLGYVTYDKLLLTQQKKNLFKNLQ